MKTQQTLLASLFAVILFAIGSAPTRALDTDVYLKAQSVVRNDVPNVLIILDNSGSMNDDVPSTRPAYDPAVNYCADDLDTELGMFGSNAGKPNNCSTIAGRIYFSFTGSPPSYTTSSSGSWFDGTKNKCLDSASAFASAGKYSTSRIASWKSGNNWKSLKNQTNSDMTYVDCDVDNSNIKPANTTSDGLILNDGKTPCSSTSIPYTGGAPACSGGSTAPYVWTSFNTNAFPVLYSSNFMNYWYNTNLDTTRPKINIAKDAVDDVINSNKNIRFGLEVFNHNSDSDSINTGNHGGRIIYKVDDMTDARRAAMVSTVNSIVAATFTPLAETMWEAYRYYSGKSVDYGDNDPTFAPLRDTTAESGGNYITPFAFACQKSYIILVTDGDPTNDTNANSKVHALTGSLLAGNSTCGNSGSSCLANLTYYMHNNDIVSTLTGNQTVTTYTVGFGTDISASGLALLQAAAAQGGGTYTSATNADQLAAALQGYLTQILTETTSFTAPSLSINAFNKQYNNNDVYLSVFKPESSIAWDGNVKKYKLCTNADISAGSCTALSDILDQNGNKITDINNNIVDTARSFWSASADGSTVDAGGAGAVIPVPASRNMYTYRESGGGYSGLTTPSTGVKVAVNATNTFYQAVTADPTLLGLPNTAVIPTDVDNLVNWMLGKDSYNKHGGVNRWAFGDPLHSRSVPITYGKDSSGNPIIKLFVGANDGTIRMINNDNNTNPGVEEWAFIPQEAYAMQYQLSQEADADHLYGMDGTPNFWIKDINNDGIIDPSAGDRVYMFIGMRRGGRNIYAFDVTPSATLTTQSGTFTPKLMWAIKGGSGNFTQLGQTWSQPRITRVAYNCPTPVAGSVCDDGNGNTDDSRSRVVLMFAGGYDTNQDNAIPAGTDAMGNAIYMVDPLTGSRIWWASSAAGASLVLSQMKYGIPSDLTLVDSDGDGKTDRLFVGDMGGQVWRIDFDQVNFTATNNGTTAGYVFADVGCTGDVRSNNCAATTAQNRRKFFYPPAFAPVRDTAFSTPANYDLIAIGSGDREDPLDLLTSNLASPQSKEAVHNRIYAFRDYNYKTGVPSTAQTAIDETVMYDATANNISTSTGTALQTEINNLKGSKGWYISLQHTPAITVPNGLTTTWIGEKVLAPAKVLEGLLFVTTFTPANDTSATSTCSANEGVATEWVLNALDAVGEGDFQLNGTLTRSGQIGGGIPSEVVIVFRPDGTTGLINAGGKGGAPVGAIGVPQKGTARNYWYEE